MQIKRTGDINNVKEIEVFTLYAITNTANTHIVCPICTVISNAHDLTSWPSGKRVRLWNQKIRVDSRMGSYYKLFLFFFFRLVMQNYFIQVIWNYINDKNYTP